MIQVLVRKMKKKKKRTEQCYKLTWGDLAEVSRVSIDTNTCWVSSINPANSTIQTVNCVTEVS